MRPATFGILLIFLSILFACGPMPIPTADPRTPLPASTTAPSAIPPSTNSPRKPKVLRINIGIRPDVLDPQRASTNGEIAVLQLAYEGLTRLDESGRVTPGAAESWEFSNDGKTITYHLRDQLTRADGSPLTAKDFEYALKHAIDPRSVAPDQSFLDDVQGALAAYSLDPKSKPDDVQKALDAVGIKASDDRTLVVNFNQPTGYWNTIAATWIAFPSDRNKFEADPDAWWYKPEGHNGNGPFRISDIQEQFIKFVPNPNYWGSKPKLERIEVYWISDPAAAIESYAKGDVDVLKLTTENFSQALADSRVNKELVRYPAARVSYLGFNVKKAPFTDKNVRIAFSQALDREGFVRDVLKGMGKPYASFIPPGIPGYDDSATVPAFDPKAAVQTLINGNFGTPDKKRVDCNRLGQIKLSYSNTPRNQTIFQYLVGNFARAFACPILLDPIEPKDYPFVTKDPRTIPQVYLITWEQEYPHPQNWLFLQTCTGVFATRIGYCSKDFDAAFASANQELDYGKAIEKYKAAQKIFVNDVPGAFLWNSENAYLVKPYVLGLADHRSTSDAAWVGQFGPLSSYDIDTSRVSVNYPKQ